jgi:hypothetical protein
MPLRAGHSFQQPDSRFLEHQPTIFESTQHNLLNVRLAAVTFELLDQAFLALDAPVKIEDSTHSAAPG